MTYELPRNDNGLIDTDELLTDIWRFVLDGSMHKVHSVIGTIDANARAEERERLNIEVISLIKLMAENKISPRIARDVWEISIDMKLSVNEVPGLKGIGKSRG